MQMDPGIRKSSLAANSDTCMKGRKRMKIAKEGEDCVSSTLSAKMDGDLEEKAKKDALKVVDPFDPCAIPNLFRTLARSRFGSVTEKVEALKLKLLNPSPRMKPARSFMSSDEGKTKKRKFPNLAEKQDSQPSHQKVKNKHVSPPVHPIDIDQWVISQSTETCSDQSVSKPAQDAIHLEDDNAGIDHKEVTTIIIISDSDVEDDGVQMPSHQCHKAAEKSLTDVPSMNDLKVRASAEKEVPKEEVGSAAAEIDFGLNKGNDLCDYYLGVRDPVERKAQKEEVSNKFAFGMDESVYLVFGCPEKKTLEEEVKMVLNIEDRSAKNTDIETNESRIEDDNRIDHCDYLQVRGSTEKVPKEEVGSAATKIDIGLNKGIDFRDYYLGVRDPAERKAQKEDLSNKFAFGMDEIVDQVIGCPEKKPSEEEVKMVLDIEDRSAKNAYIDTNENLMIIEDDNWIDSADDMGRKRSEFHIQMDESVRQVTGCLDRKALEEVVETVPDIDVRSAKNTYINTDGNMMIEEDNDQIHIADDMGSQPSEIHFEMDKSIDHVAGCSKREASKEEVETMMIKEDNDQIHVADYVGSQPSEILLELDKSIDYVAGCSVREASEEEVETVTSIDVRSAKNTYTDTDGNMMIKEDSNQIHIADDGQCQSSEIDAEMDNSIDHVERKTSGKEVESITDIAVIEKEYMDTNDDLVIEENYNQADTENDDDLTSIWKEMVVALELSKDIAPVSRTSEHSKDDEEECEHLSVHKDDLGDVCRICGIIVKGIETIFDFQYSKVKRTIRTYVSEPRDTSSRGLNNLPSGVNSLGDNSMPSEICAHPRHRKQMKPHQVEGFNFLCSNLLAEVPGGCILAHAPGSGKTFTIISFLQSFLAKCPEGKPLVVLPKGILATWKKEFKTWQVEDMALLDFHTSKAKNRSQQLDVLIQWEKQKSILFLGYQQFTSFFRDDRSSKVAAACQDKLLKVPSILILDEGHTPRNHETDTLQSLAKVRTPRKVVLSGTLYQNHVEEVFTLLNLVRPKFLRLDTSRAVVSRIMSTVRVSGSRKAGNDSAFFNSVEYTLQKDENLLRKKAVIQNLREMTRNVLHYYRGDFLDELPGLVDFTVVLNLSKKQKEEVKKLKELGRLKQITLGSALYVHPELKDFLERYPDAEDRNSPVNIERIDEMLEKLDARHGVKMKFFLNILGLCESTGEKLLVFSQYRLPLKLLERASVKNKGWTAGKEIFLINGDSKYEERERSMQQFNSSPDAKVFFGSIRACGEGISLVGASRILILDVPLNPSVIRQAIGRAFRPGQKRKVYTYKLIAAGTPEEEDYLTCFRKEVISKMWFEWRESSEFPHFKMNTVDLDECDDLFFESPLLQEDVKVLYRR